MCLECLPLYFKCLDLEYLGQHEDRGHNWGNEERGDTRTGTRTGDGTRTGTRTGNEPTSGIVETTLMTYNHC